MDVGEGAVLERILLSALGIMGLGGEEEEEEEEERGAVDSRVLQQRGEVGV